MWHAEFYFLACYICFMEEFCECGTTHKLSTEEIYVGHSAAQKLLDAIRLCEHRKVLVFYTQNSKNILSFIQDSLGFEIKTYLMQSEFASTLEAESIEDFGCDLVVAIGEERVISLAKFYAYSFEAELYILPMKDFLDYTFSSFCRLFDNARFSFYSSCEPKKIFVLSENCDHELQTIYIASKFIALFDGEVAECVFKQNFCARMKKFFSEALGTFLAGKCLSFEDQITKNIWLLIRLGQGMSFFGQTKYFFGGDQAISEQLCMMKKANYLEVETIALKLVVNAYSNFFASVPYQSSMNLNKHIDALSKLDKLSPTMVMNMLVDSQLLLSPDIRKRFLNYYPYLKNQLKTALGKVFSIQAKVDIKENYLKKFSFSAFHIEKSFALAGDIHSSPCTLHLLLNFGYMDKLL